MEKYCMTHNIGGRLIPIPREISAECGIAWRMSIEDFPMLEAELQYVRYEEIVELML